MCVSTGIHIRTINHYRFAQLSINDSSVQQDGKI